MTKKLRALLERKEKLVAKAKGILQQAKSAGRDDMTAEEQDGYDAAMASIRAIDLDIAEEQDVEQRERTAPAISGPLSRPVGLGGADTQRLVTRRGVGRLFAEMFPDAQLDTHGFDDESEFLKVLHQGRHDPRLMMATAGGSEGIGQDGGFLVPAQFAARMMDASLETEIVRPRATIEPMTSNMKHTAGLDTSNHTANIGGFSGQWVEEGGSLNTQKWKLTKLLLIARKLGIYTPISNELIADAEDFDAKITDALIKAIGWYFDYAFLRGTGAGQPRGVLSDPALIVVSKESGQAADTIVYENLTKMLARLHPSLMNECVWVANPTAIPSLLNLRHVVQNVAGTENVGGSHVPVLTGNARDGFTLLTRPVLFTEKLPSLGDQGDILLAGFSQYIVGLRKEIVIDKSAHVGFTTDETGYRAIARADGMGKWKGPITPKNGDTLSWAVTLEARA